MGYVSSEFMLNFGLFEFVLRFNEDTPLIVQALLRWPSRFAQDRLWTPSAAG